MKNTYQAPELILIGEADDVVMGGNPAGLEGITQAAPDFEFEHDWPSF